MTIDAPYLILLADEIDSRLGPIPGHRADNLAKVLRAAAAQHESLMAAVQDVLSAHDKFRSAMGPWWEGDPLTDACDKLRAAFPAAGSAPESKT